MRKARLILAAAAAGALLTGCGGGKSAFSPEQSLSLIHISEPTRPY